MVAKNACAVGPPTVSAFLGKSFLNCLRDFWNPTAKLRHLAHFRQCSERENSISKSSNPHLKGKSFPNEPISLAKDQCRTNRDQKKTCAASNFLRLRCQQPKGRSASDFSKVRRFSQREWSACCSRLPGVNVRLMAKPHLSESS